MREIKFRGKSKKDGKWLYGDLLRNVDGDFAVVQPFGIHMNNYCDPYEVNPDTIGQYTGLKDKSNNICIFEGDILSLSGILIGNKYENEGLLKDGTNLLIDGLCTKEWLSTYQEAIKRGCINAK